MKRIALLAAAGWLLAGALPAWAFTHPASRAALPDAKTLLAQMAHAIQSRNTVHLVIDATSQLGHQPATHSHQVADISYHPLQFTEVSDSGGFHESIIVQGNHVATELGTHWTCLVSRQILQQYSGIIKDLTPPTVSARTIGATTISGIPVWHIRASYVISNPGQTMPSDLYVSRSDSTLVELTGTLTMREAGSSITSRTVERLSKYGEHLSIRLPAACKK